jgi:hypothetical protein
VAFRPWQEYQFVKLWGRGSDGSWWRCCWKKKKTVERGGKPGSHSCKMGRMTWRGIGGWEKSLLEDQADFFFLRRVLGRPPFRPQRESASCPYLLAVALPPLAAMQRGHTS